MEKVLKKYTMIPQDLYVYRNADKQLKAIVDEMQRPGYVLVARQMGKTNLLFNAKRELEHDGRLFIYVDLSNTFKRERDCYRSIIDTVLEPNEVIFESIESEIEKIRDKKYPPHNEYSKSLRVILKKFEGIIVIILDEIDALRSADYSDNIFAQIRSNYFSRTNFPEFERLTYILSGVIEPTELIKDRNKSPFNIGEKIYLNDFTKEEHDTFITKSSLDISNEISNNIFEWTKGNPRLTFDICSDIESHLLNNDKNVTIDDLKKLINKKYLTNFDIAPIDHIRELIKSNKIARSAVLKIQQESSVELSDEVKKKLYLYGIINSDFDKETTIKNKIIKLSLTEDWIKSVDRETEDKFSYGLNLFHNDEYSECIEVLSEFLSNSTPSKTEIELVTYYLGYSHYNLNDYRNSIVYFDQEFIGEPYNRNSKTLLGVSKIALGEKEEGQEILEKIILEKSNDFSYHNALLNLARQIDDEERVFSLYQDLYDSVNEIEDRTEDLNLLITLSLYHQGEILLKTDSSAAIDKFTNALDYSSKSNSVFLKYLIYKLQDKKDETIKSYIVNTIIEQNLNIENTSSNSISFCRDHLSYYLGLVFDAKQTNLFEKLLDYSEKKSKETNNFNKYKFAFDARDYCDEKIEFLNYLEKFNESFDLELHVSIHKDLCVGMASNEAKFLIQFEKYKQLFIQTGFVDRDDIYIFSIAIKTYADLKEYAFAIESCELISNKINELDNETLNFEALIIFYWYAHIYLELDNKEDATFYADKTLNIIKDSKVERTSGIDEEGLKSITRQMNNILISGKTIKPIVTGKKYGRNEKVIVKYLDGRVIEEKYKKIEKDIRDKKCQIIT